ncbi:hypothetical protein ACH5RR_029925 [Cinchona calisaya]|uniref:hAT-like transposase RNase-H fold domain-containing protein n=1 Tax=Cinchona calisaya TaxID=153742 RepID=A0ABD2YT36_9GENT
MNEGDVETMVDLSLLPRNGPQESQSISTSDKVEEEKGVEKSVVKKGKRRPYAWKHFDELPIAVVLDPWFKFQLIEFSYKKLYGEKSTKWCKECAIVKEKLLFLFEAYISTFTKPSTSSGGCTSQRSGK